MGKLTGTDDVLVVEHGAPVQRRHEGGSSDPDKESNEHQSGVVLDGSGQCRGDGRSDEHSGHYDTS